MTRQMTSCTRVSCRAAGLASFFAALACLAVLDRSGLAAEFKELVNQIPRSANAIVLLNMEKAKNSPLGLKEDWKGKITNAFASGLFRVPPQATKFISASEIDFESKELVWTAVVMELDEEIQLKSLERARGGTLDTIDGMTALSLPNNTYLLQLGPKILGAMMPGNRQAVVRWVREMKKTSATPLSSYLQKAAAYSDEAGSEVIMAIDLDGALSFERIGKNLKSHQKELDEWRADLVKTAQILSNVQGIRIGVRIGDQQSSMLAIDLHADASPVASFAKPLLLQILSDQGALIEDFESWTVQTKGNEISMAGLLSDSGRRKLLSVLDSPVNEFTTAKEPSVSPGELPSVEASKSRDYFRTIVDMADDLKSDLRDAKNLASKQLYYDKYARRIQRMPILGVNEELINYGAFVANCLRQATGAVKTMGIQSGARQAQITGGYGYGDYGGYGAGFYDPNSDVKATGVERRAVRAEEKATMATSIQQIREKLISATTETRRKMTQKYQIEF